MRRPQQCSLCASGLLVFFSIWQAGHVWAGPPVQANFPAALNGDRVRLSSISLGDLGQDGLPEIVVGTNDGKVHAYTRNGTKLWDYDTGAMAIEGKAAIGDVDGDGFAEVVVGAGSTFTPNAHGGLYVIDHMGNLQCDFKTLDATSTPDGWRDGVYSSPALADLDGNDGGLLEIAFGAWDRRVRVIHHDCTVLWENNVYDAVWGSPAIGDVNRDGQLDVVIGVDGDSLNPPIPVAAQDGGLLYVYDGKTGAVIAGFPRQVDEVLWSSPALGDLDGDGFLEIVVGTGYCWANPNCAVDRDDPNVGKEIHAWDHLGNVLPGWPVDLVDKYAFASPALADLDDDGELEVIVNTIDPDDVQGGLVYVLNPDGSNVPGWPTQPTTVNASNDTFHTSTNASPVVADLTGDGQLEVLLASSFEIVVWDRNGNQLTLQTWPPPPADLYLKIPFAIASSPAVGDIDGDGDVELVVGSADGTGSVGTIYAWDFSGAASAAALPWPMFRANAPNQANASVEHIFADGFESGNTSAWSASAP